MPSLGEISRARVGSSLRKTETAFRPSAMLTLETHNQTNIPLKEPKSKVVISRTGSIYVIVNTINGRRYVGQTLLKPKLRWNHHVYDARKRPSQEIHVAMSQHGISCFEFCVLEQNVSMEAMDSREKYYIDLFDSMNPHKGYNVQGGGKYNQEVSEITKQKISRSLKRKNRSQTPEEKEWLRAGREKFCQENPEFYKEHFAMMRAKRKFGPEFREKTRQRMLGNTNRRGKKQVYSSEQKRKNSYEALCRPKSEEHKKKLSESQKGRKFTPEHIENIRKAVALREEKKKLNKLNQANRLPALAGFEPTLN